MSASESTPQRTMSAEAMWTQAERVREMCGVLRRFLDEELSRTEMAAWCRSVAEADSERPFRGHGTAMAVFDSLWNMEEEGPDGPWIRASDAMGYLRWLEEGEGAGRSVDVLAALERRLESVAPWLGHTPEVRFWLDGIGWVCERLFASPATGRRYVAVRNAGESATSIYGDADAEVLDAFVDLVETLAVDDSDLSHLHPGIDLDSLPTWTLYRQDDNGNVVSMGSYRSYAKAETTRYAKELLGHKQTYWIEGVEREGR